MKDLIQNIKQKIKDFLFGHLKVIIFLIIFILVSVLYNQNFQTLNYILKRGVILEYSLPKNTKIVKDDIKKELIKLKVKYSFIEQEEKNSYLEFDSDEQLIENSLYIALAVLPDENKKQLFNDISDFVFKNYKSSKLIELRTINDIYSTPYSAFLKFLGLLFISLFFWSVFIYLFSEKQGFFAQLKENTGAFFKKRYESVNKFIQKTKEKGIGYFIKRLLFDESDDEKDINVTKEIINTVIFVLLCVIVIRYFIGELRWIPSGSMHPTIVEHDRVFVEKLDYPKKEIKRGDILVFYPPKVELSNSPFAILARLSGIFCHDIAYIKRVIGLPNDKLEIKYNEKTDEYRVFINDIPLNEPYIKSKRNWTSCSEKGVNCGPFIIPENNYFMMGDNRDNSQDSRYWGFMNRNRVIGRANFMFFPIGRINVLTDKYIKLHKQIKNDKIMENVFILNRYEFLYKI